MARDKRFSPKPVPTTTEVVSIIGPGVLVKGDIESQSAVRIEGDVHGAVRAKKSVVVGGTGNVTGDIMTQDIVVAGKVTGTLTAGSRVELKNGCTVSGDIQSRTIALEEGGQVNGRLDMGKDAASSAAAVAQKGHQNLKMSPG